MPGPQAPRRDRHFVVSSFTRWDARARKNLAALVELASAGFSVRIRNKVGAALTQHASELRTDGEPHLEVVAGDMTMSYRTWTDLVPSNSSWVTVLHDDDEWIGAPTFETPPAHVSALAPLLINPHGTGKPPLRFPDSSAPRSPAQRLRAFDRLPLPLLFGAIRGDTWQEWASWVTSLPQQWPSLDVQLNLAVLMRGDVASLPSFYYAYDSTNWESADSTIAQGEVLFESIGLPPLMVEYDQLFIGLNSLSLLAHLRSSLTDSEVAQWTHILVSRLWPLSRGRTSIVARIPSAGVRSWVVRHRDGRSGRTVSRPPTTSKGLAFAYGIERSERLPDVLDRLIPALETDCPELVERGVIARWRSDLLTLQSSTANASPHRRHRPW